MSGWPRWWTRIPGRSALEREATLQALRAAIESREPPETADYDNVRSLAAMLGCVRSIESGEPVNVTALLAAKGAKL